MKILGINTGHNGSAAYVVDGELQWYIEEERLSRHKYDGNPFRGIIEAAKSGIDILIIGGTCPERPGVEWTNEDVFTALVRKFNPLVEVLNIGNEHHLGHAAGAFYNSGFETAAALVVDGSGSLTFHYINEEEEDDNLNNEDNIARGFETESIFSCSYPAEFDCRYKSIGNNYGGCPSIILNNTYFYDDSVTITKAYEAVTHYLGFGFIEAGKTMGLASYGKEDKDFPNLFFGPRGDRNFFTAKFPMGAILETNKIAKLINTAGKYEWHRDPSLVTDAQKNIAWKIQQETQKLVGDLIEKAAKVTGEKNIVIAGGYGLNCVANYYFQQRFPELNIYIDPVAHDGGTAIGIAKLAHYDKTQDTIVRPLTTLYNGVTVPEYNHLEHLDGIELSDATHEEVAQLIKERNIVALFQGRSEGGPRALGNRSILYDPTDPNGKDHVNKVKGREWFRPFAGSMLKEHFDEWFETHGLEESPYMMYAMDVKMEKHGEIPAITHVDGTCRIQTVTQEQNDHYYKLIDEFYKLSGVPILFNTSFNLAGEPLVETLEDAINTINNCEIDYLYLPEIGKLVKKIPVEDKEEQSAE